MDDSILNVVHDSACELRDAGVLDAKTMREFDAHCLPGIRDYAADEIRKIREKNKASQAVFAAYLNTSVSTVQKWEQGKKRPANPSLKLLDLVDRKGIEALA